jgi:hypothetical protein
VTDLSAWWRQVGPLLRKAVPQRVKVSANFAAGLPEVSIAPHWLTQAMLNLIVNAGESIAAEKRTGRVTLSAIVSEDARTIRLAVADNGRGMTHTVQRRAMDLFFTTKTRAMGTGLGLPLARKVAVRAGGNIEIVSARGKGTTVYMTLPVTSGTPAAPAPKRQVTVSVNDHRAVALITHVLSKAGFLLRPAVRRGPGLSCIWVTEPTAARLTLANRWRRRNAGGIVVLLGAPSARTEAAWRALGALVIEPADDFEAIRFMLGRAAANGRSDP